MVEKLKNRIKIVMNYEKYDPKLADKIATLLIQEGYKIVCADLVDSIHTRTFYFSKRD